MHRHLTKVVGAAALSVFMVGMSDPVFAQSGTGTAGTSSAGTNDTAANSGAVSPGQGTGTGLGTSPASPSPGAGVGTNNSRGMTSSGSSNTGTGSAVTAPNGQAAASLPLQFGANGRSVYNVSQTIADSLASSNDLQIAARNVEIDRRQSDEAAAAARPNVTVNAQASRFDKATVISLGGSPPIEVLPNHTEQVSINLADRLDITGQIQAASNQARLQSLADQFTYNYIRNQRILRAKTIYFNLLRADHQVQVAQSALTTAQRQLQDAQNLNAAQVGQKIDVYRAATQVATAQQQLTASLNNRDIARQNFNDLVGRPLAEPVQAEDVSGVNVGTDVTNNTSVGAQSPLAFTPYTVAPTELSSIDIDKSLNTAYLSRPEILTSQLNVRVAQTGIKLARAGLEPTLSINAAGDYYPTTSFQNPRKRVALVTANLSVPVYDGGATRDRVDEARLRTENAKSSLDATREDVALDVRQSYLNLATAARQIDAANTALQQAVAARQLAQVRYEGQVGTYLEVTDAQAALVQAENGQIDAVYDYLVAKAQFQNSLGTPQTQ